MPMSSYADKGVTPCGGAAGSRTGPTQDRREELQKEVLDLLSSQQPSDPALRTPSSRLLQPSTPAAAARAPSPVNGKTPHSLLPQQRFSSFDGTHSDKEDRDQRAVVVPVLPKPRSAPHEPHGPASSGSITRPWLDDMAHDPHGHPPGWRGLPAHCKQAARVSVATW